MSKYTKREPLPEVNLDNIRAARIEADFRGWRSPEWGYIRYLLDLIEECKDDVTGPAYHNGYRAGWNDAIDEIARQIEAQRRE